MGRATRWVGLFAGLLLTLTLVATPPGAAAAHQDREAHHHRSGIAANRLREPQLATATRGYALVSHGELPAGLATTLDGGRRWTSMRHPALPPDGSLTLTRRLLLVWGREGLFTRTTGRPRWHHPITDRVGQVAVVGSSVWATTWPCDIGTRCRGRLQTSADFGRTWTTRARLPRGVGPRGGTLRLVRDTRRLAYLVRPDLGRDGALAVTSDGGRRWTHRSLPDATEGEFTGNRPLAVGSDGGLWLAVPGEPSAGNEAKAIYRSADRGQSWQRVAVSSPPGQPGDETIPTAGYVTGIKAVGSDSAYLVLSRALPLVTTDGGRSWHSTFSNGAPTPGGDYATVSLSTLGRSRAWLWIDLARHLWTTDDAGGSWSVVAGYPIRRTLPPCSSDQLHIWLEGAGSNMSQPYARIGLRNISPTACTLRGYPRLSVWGGTLGTPDAHRMSIRVRRGSFMEARDRGPRRIGLRPGSRAVFSIGTATAYSAHLIGIKQLELALPGVAGRLQLALDIDATAPPGKRIPVSVTAVDWRVR